MTRRTVNTENSSAETPAKGVVGRVGRLVRRLPGSSYAEEKLHDVEQRVLRELKHRMDALDERRPAAPAGHSSGSARSPASRRAGAVPVNLPAAELMADLLERANEQTAEQSRQYLYQAILRELVPDEARILSALSAGDAFPLVHVGLGPPIGQVTRRIAENFSTVGKAALVKLQDRVPRYITHLRKLELVETGPEDRAFDMKYQILESEAVVRQLAEKAAKNAGVGTNVRYIRRILRIAPLGKQLWEACQPASSG